MLVRPAVNHDKTRKSLVYIGVGSNLGDPFDNSIKAMECLAGLKDTILLRHSSLYWSDPVGPVPQPRFLNSVVLLSTLLLPMQLLIELKKIEKHLGRKPGILWGSRIIDLDILFYGNLVLYTGNLVIPHPRINERLFVLMPLLEITPEFRHPVSHKHIDEIVTGLKKIQHVIMGYRVIPGTPKIFATAN